jgi:branched-chain amino acid transport system substrate-binding protein
MGRTRHWLTLGAIGLLATACSVSTPRHGTTAAGQAPGGGTATSALPGGAVANGSTASGATGSAGVPGAGGTASPGGRSAAGTAADTATAGADPDAVALADGAAPAPTVDAGPVGPGVSDDEIVVSVVAGFTGVLAPVVETAYEGLETARDDINAAGGINGRRLTFVRVDHKETADGGIAACKEVTSNGSFVALVPEGVEANLTAVSCLDQAGIPTLYFSGTIDPAWQLAFSDVVSSAQGGSIMGSYVRDGLGVTDQRVGVIYVNQLAYRAMADAFVESARALGLDVAPPEAVEPNQAAFTPQLLRLREAGVDVVVISATAEAIGILRDAASIGYRPTFTGWGFLFDFVTAAGRDLFDGVTGLRTNATVDTAAYEAYAARMEANGRGRRRDLDTEGFLAYGHTLLLIEMLTRAGPSPNRSSFVSGAETIAGYDNGILPPITYGPGDHIGADAAFPAVCCNGDWTWRAHGPARGIQ